MPNFTQDDTVKSECVFVLPPARILDAVPSAFRAHLGAHFFRVP